MEGSINFETKNNQNNLQNENNIKDKIDITDNKNNNECIINTPNNNDKTFNKLCKLQKLIKKESALREFCKYKI